MDYIRIKSQSRKVAKSQSGDSSEPIANGQQLTVDEIKDLLKDWIKLYPNSFAPDVEFKIYQLSDGDIIVELHEDLSSMAVALLVLYFENINQQPTAFITIEDTEVLLKQNEGKRAMIFCNQQPTAVRFLLEDNYVLDYDFERKPQPVKDCDMIFEEEELLLPEEYDSVVVGDVVKKKIDSILEEEGLTPKKMLMYILCGAIGLSIGFLIVHFMGK